MRRTVICGLSDSPKCFHIISQTAQFLDNVIEHKMCVLIFSASFFQNISHSKKKLATYMGLHVTYWLFLSVFNET